MNMILRRNAIPCGKRAASQPTFKQSTHLETLVIILTSGLDVHDVLVIILFFTAAPPYRSSHIYRLIDSLQGYELSLHYYHTTISRTNLSQMGRSSHLTVGVQTS